MRLLLLISILTPCALEPWFSWTWDLVEATDGTFTLWTADIPFRGFHLKFNAAPAGRTAAASSGPPPSAAAETRDGCSALLGVPEGLEVGFGVDSGVSLHESWETEGAAIPWSGPQMSTSSKESRSLPVATLGFLLDGWTWGSACFVLCCPWLSSLVLFLFKEVKCGSFAFRPATAGFSLAVLVGLCLSRFDSSSSSSSPNSNGGCQWNVSLSFWCFLFDLFPFSFPWCEPLFSLLLCLCLRLDFFLLLCFSGSGDFLGRWSDWLDRTAATFFSGASPDSDVFLWAT